MKEKYSEIEDENKNLMKEHSLELETNVKLIKKKKNLG